MTIKRFFQRLYVAFFFALAAFTVLAVLLFLNQRTTAEPASAPSAHQPADELRQAKI